MNFKNILVICFVVSIFSNQTVSATTNTLCTEDNILISTPDVEPGNGGQNYVSDVTFSITNSDLNNDLQHFASDIAIYDWNGKHVEDVTSDSNDPNPIQVATGIVDGTYTYVLSSGNTGTFNVNHNIDNIVLIDLADFENCNNTNANFVDNNDQIQNEDKTFIQSICDSLESIAQSLNELVNKLFN